MSSRSGRVISKVVLFSLVLALSLTLGWAGTIEGSNPIGRGFTDVALGQVMIYNGGAFFDNGLTLTAAPFTVFDRSGGGGMTGTVTPVLFEETSPGAFVVRAVGTGDTVLANGLAQSFSFGTAFTTTSGLFTFGFFEGAVNSAGTPTAFSTGVVDLDSPVAGGSGVGGGTNDWVFLSSPGTGTGKANLALGQVYCEPGAGAGCNFTLNNSTAGGAQVDRTYSATLGTSAVPEPGTITLFTSGAGLLLAGLLRFRRRQQ